MSSTVQLDITHLTLPPINLTADDVQAKFVTFKGSFQQEVKKIHNTPIVFKIHVRLSVPAMNTVSAAISLQPVTTYFCLCDEYYEGEFCDDQYHDLTPDNTITDMVTNLRQGFSNFIGNPSVIDVYLDIQEIPQQIKQIHRRIMDSNKYTQIVIVYGDVFQEVAYIAAHMHTKGCHATPRLYQDIKSHFK
ncbi:hypothetical protein Pmani_031428 [Petrolisthes manimaculis]|uniref:Uncharacterized protein n=1 Tax=Petrolisthes manimaculis TaxID=1843537 RepID=A0AAE1TUW0_9EUCA|nr:hypothetical protein Pmani_031428 [Petrolisthes manimaculis]